MSVSDDLVNRALVKNQWLIKEIAGIKLVLSPALSRIPSLTHAFTTRVGGDSPPPLDRFNLGRHWPGAEAREDALINRSRLCEALSVNFARLTVPGQVHGSRIAWLTEPESLPDFDGVATVSPDCPILLHYADCVPVILYDSDSSAVCVVHAGWRGTACGIAGRAVRFLSAVLGSDPENMVAAVGPAIGQCCYPVGPEVVSALSATVDHSELLVSTAGSSTHVDLKAFNALQLLESGVGEVDISSFCTSCVDDLFYSHRKSKGKTGRHGALANISAGQWA